MSISKSTIIEKAQKLVLKGKFKEAIEEWEKLAAEAPNDGNTHNAIGDLYLKANNKKGATTAYIKAGEAFQFAAFELKSIALYKKALKVDPSRYEVYEKLAAVYEERGLIGNAIDDYLKAAKHYAKEKNFIAALTVYRKLSSLDANNVKIRIEIAEMCLKGEMNDEAIEEYKKIIAIYESKNKTVEADEIRNIVMALDPTFGEKEFPEPVLEEGIAEEGASLDDVPFDSLIPPDPVSEIASEDAISEQSGTSEEAMEGFITPESEPMAEEQTLYQTGHSMMDFQDVGDLASAAEDENALENGLTEVEVFIQYGLFEKAIDQLQIISKAFPSELKPHLKLKEIYTQQGMREQAIETCQLLIARYEALGDEKTSSRLQNELKEAFPEWEKQEGFSASPLSEAEALSSDTPLLAETTLSSTESTERNAFGEAISLGDSFSGDLSEPTIVALDDVSSTKKAPRDDEPSAISFDEEADLLSAFEVEPSNEDFVDLNDVLSGNFSGDDEGPEHALEQSFRGQESALGDRKEEEAETQYDLGMAYKEMSMISEAMEAFELAAVGDRFEGAMMMLALCHRDEGSISSAIEVLQKALVNSKHKGEQMIALKYELALLYEETGDAEAAALFQEIYHIDPTFRKVAEKCQHSTFSKKNDSPDSEISDGSIASEKGSSRDQVSFL